MPDHAPVPMPDATPQPPLLPRDPSDTDVAMLDTRIRAQATALARKNRQLEHILDIIGAARLDQPLSVLLRRLAHATCDALEFHSAVVYLAEPDGETFYAAASQGLDAAGWADVARRPVSRSVVDRLMDEHYRLGKNTFFIPHEAPIWADPLVATSLSALEQGPPLPPDADWQPNDCLLVPLIAEGPGLIGFIIPDLPIDGRVPTPEMADVLEIFANSAALLIQNARLYRRSEQQASRLAMLTEIAKVLSATLNVEDLAQRVYEQVSRVLDTSSFYLAARAADGTGLARILVIDAGVRYPGGQLPYPVDPDGARAPRIYTADQPRNDGRDRYGNGLPSAVVISAPMYAGEALVGELCIGAYTPRAYTQEDAWLLQAIADQTALALENARLYEREVARAASLQEISRLRHDFIATVSHELRTPLTSIIGFTETLLSYWDRLPERRKLDMLSKSRSSIYRLNRLVQDLLLTSGIDSEALTLEPREVELAAMVDQAVSEVRGKYGLHAVSIEIPASLCVYADPHRVEQVLVNLVDNAAKYSPEGTTVAVAAESNDGMAVVRIRDEGPGIAPDKQHLLFTRFGKIDSAIRSGHVGTGLGLYISRRLTEAMGGTIWLDRSGPEGATFAFSLPLTPGRLAQPRSPQDRRYT